MISATLKSQLVSQNLGLKMDNALHIVIICIRNKLKRT